MILNLLYIVLSVITIVACVRALIIERQMKQNRERLDREYDAYYRDLYR